MRTTSPCRSAASSNPGLVATSRCTPSISTRSSRRPGSICREGGEEAFGAIRRGSIGVSETLHFLATAPRGLADLLARELETFGGAEVRERSTDVSFEGTLETAYRACLESRVANRVYLHLATFEAPDADRFYSEARKVD